MLFTLRHLSAAPWGTPLLCDIDLALSAGEVLGIIGPNGAGKTSLLHVLSGDVVADSGEYELFGTAISNWDAATRARRLAVLPQLSLLNFPYSVEEVVMLGRTPHRSGLQEDRRILREVLQATDTEALRARIYTQLSGGEKQRVQLARVFAQVWRDDEGPRLLLLDEPTTALDLSHQQLVMETVGRLAESGCGVVMVAHDFNLVAAAADRVVALSDGKVIAHGSTHEVMCEQVFADVFGIGVTILSHPATGRPLVVAG